MADDRDAAHAQQRRAAVFRIIGALAEIVEGLLRKRVPQLRRCRLLLIAFFSMPPMCSTNPSLIFSAMFPMNPSQTITSTFPRKTSRPFHVPARNSAAVCFSRLEASRVSSLPFISSSPIESNATRGLRTSENRPVVNLAHHRELLDLRRASNPRSRPRPESPKPSPSCSETRPPAPDDPPKAVCRSTNRATVITAPVLPALTSASAFPSRTSRAATCSELSFFLRNACDGESRIVITSVAFTISIGMPAVPMPVQLLPHRRLDAHQHNRTSSSRAARTAPSTSARGAWSPPIASRAMVII